MVKPISDKALAELRDIDVPEWESNPNSTARAYRMADHVAALIARIDRAEDDIDD